MRIVKAEEKHCLSAIRSIQKVKLDYISTEKVKEDIHNNRLYLAIDNGRILGMASLVPEPDFNYYAIKRLIVPNKKNRRRGISESIIKYILEKNPNLDIGCTPWSDNDQMKHLVNKLGFKYQYTFNTHWDFYLKRA